MCSAADPVGLGACADVCGNGRYWRTWNAYRRRVVDRYLRPLKARVYAPLLGPLAGVPADAVTAVGMALGLAAAAAAALGRFEWALLARGDPKSPSP